MAGNRREREMVGFLFVIVRKREGKSSFNGVFRWEAVWELVSLGFVIVGLERMPRFSKLPVRVALFGC